jgi:hypothetical protein
MSGVQRVCVTRPSRDGGGGAGRLGGSDLGPRRTRSPPVGANKRMLGPDRAERGVERGQCSDAASVKPLHGALVGGRTVGCNLSYDVWSGRDVAATAGPASVTR